MIAKDVGSIIHPPLFVMVLEVVFGAKQLKCIFMRNIIQRARTGLQSRGQ